MKIGLVVQRYGDEIVGGAEIHARFVAERLARRHEVEVLTTTAIDYRTFGNEYPPGLCSVGGLPVRRFTVDRERVQEDFDEISNQCCYFDHGMADEKQWLDEHGPVSGGLLSYLRQEHRRFHRLIFFCYRYWTTYYGLAVAPEKSILVPTAEHDRVLYFQIFADLFQKPVAIAYNSIEERELIQRITQNGHVRGTVVGVGIREIPHPKGAELRKMLDLPEPFALYVGRIEREKGCLDLLSHFLRHIHETGDRLQLVLAGKRVDGVPDHPSVTYLGVVPDDQKLGLMATAEMLIMPSRYESLSMVLLEAWSRGTPALVNGDCEVLRGQCYRSNGGLLYRDYAEFSEALQWLRGHRAEARRMGMQGRAYFRAHYDWSVIEQKYEWLLGAPAAHDRSLGL